VSIDDYYPQKKSGVTPPAPLHIHMPGHDPERPTLRDQFAMAALTGLLMGGGCGGFKEAAEASFELADAMMKERGRD